MAPGQQALCPLPPENKPTVVRGEGLGMAEKMKEDKKEKQINSLNAWEEYLKKTT